MIIRSKRIAMMYFCNYSYLTKAFDSFWRMIKQQQIRSIKSSVKKANTRSTSGTAAKDSTRSIIEKNVPSSNPDCPP